MLEVARKKTRTTGFKVYILSKNYLNYTLEGIMCITGMSQARLILPWWHELTFCIMSDMVKFQF